MPGPTSTVRETSVLPISTPRPTNRSCHAVSHRAAHQDMSGTNQSNQLQAPLLAVHGYLLLSQSHSRYLATPLVDATRVSAICTLSPGSLLHVSCALWSRPSHDLICLRRYHALVTHHCTGDRPGFSRETEQEFVQTSRREQDAVGRGVTGYDTQGVWVQRKNTESIGKRTAPM